MDAQRSPDELTSENALICEKLLGWKRYGKGCDGRQIWQAPDFSYPPQPSFTTTWAEAGLILDWLMSHIGPGLEQIRDDLALHLRNRTLTPLNIRAAAIGYVRSLP